MIRLTFCISLILLLTRFNFLFCADEAVILLDKNILEVKNENDAKFFVHRQILVNNEKGKAYGRFTVQENKFIECKKISGEIKDISGKRLKELDEDEIIESNISPGFTLYDENEYKSVNLTWSQFPYIIDYSYELKLKSLFFWPDWFPQNNVPVTHSIYRLKIDKEINYNTYSLGIDVDPDIQDKGDKLIITWMLNNIPPRLGESRMPPEHKIQMALYFAPEYFKLASYRGSNNSWKEFGKWYESILDDRCILNDTEKAVVRKLVKSAIEPREKVRILYKYLQDNTRYVHINLGISGWQPQPASDVWHKKYGDCKDLTNLFVAMARTTGLKAYPVLILTRDEGVLLDSFPNNQFNHVIGVVPLEEDTLWVECTADLLAAGQLSENVEGCRALVVKDNTGELINTPQSSAEQNISICRLTGQLNGNSTFSFTGQMRYEGNSAYSHRNRLSGSSQGNQRKWIVNTVGRYVPSINLEEYKISNLSENFDQPLCIEINGEIKKFAFKSTNRLFLNLTFLNRKTAANIPDETERKFPINYAYPYTTIDSVSIKIPQKYTLEAAPENIHIQYSFGEYKAAYEVKKNTVLFTRQWSIRQKLISPKEYPDYLQFMKKVVKNDNAKIVFVSKW